MSLDELIRNTTSRAGVVRVRNALNPMLWACAVISPICFGFADLFWFDPVLRYALAGLGSAPVLVALSAYVYFMVSDPDRLQSEEYRIRQRALQILYRRGQSADIVDIANHRPRIETGRGLAKPEQDGGI